VLLDRNVTVSLNYQRLFEMNKEYQFPFILKSTDTTMRTISESGHDNFHQDGYLYTLSPALAVQVMTGLYVGVTYNMWDNFFGQNGWDVRSEQVQKKVRERDIPSRNRTRVTQTDIKVIREEDNSFEGENWHLGFLTSLTESITLGGVVKTAFDADIEKKKTVTRHVCRGSGFAGSPIIERCADAVESTKENFELKMPASYGLGLSYRHSDKLTFAFDVYYTEWSRFVLRDSDGNERNPLTGFSIDDGRLKDTTQVRVGTEYLYIKGKNVIPLRLGLFYDPEPATGHIDDYYGISVGTGLARNNLVFDISYQYRTGDNVTTDFLNVPDSDPDVDQHTVMASLILYLDDLLKPLKKKDEDEDKFALP
jgi:long-subunit fatty acid transport protein